MDLFADPPSPNTRIPPILLARATQKNATQTDIDSDPYSTKRRTHLAALSKQKLSAETATGDPDLRRCLGHHRLLRRSMQETHDDMKRYLDEALESDSEGEDDAEDELEESDDEDPLGVWGYEVRLRQKSEKATDTDTDRGRERARMREKIVGVVRGLVGRQRHHSLAAPLRLRLTTTTAGTADDTGLRRVSEKNSSCSDIPIRICVQQHTVADDLGPRLETSHTQTQAEARLRGRRYAERLGFRRKCPSTVVATVPVA
ncbi:uncharacterized protein BJX67DRAFT_307928 [Aspergillus lucknowensis]|uniref:Uncharacterized protein n=1 Tax=Aspergillus lucknowensis TaxID=176173 RepID=A0ABR4M030_9EURO